jgi:hypothetical protein
MGDDTTTAPQGYCYQEVQTTFQSLSKTNLENKEKAMSTVMSPTLNKKSGKGKFDGVVSELTAFFGVKPGHEEELRAALVRFADVIRKTDPNETMKTGLRDSRHVIFDNGRRLLWTTTFETDWDPYLDDALVIVGVQHFIDWMDHVEEAKVLTPWLQRAGGREKLTNMSSEEFAETMK